MTTNARRSIPRIASLAWVVIGVVSALLVAYGVIWVFTGPEMALTNIAERTSLVPDDFRLGAPSAFDVIRLISNQFAIYVAAVGVLMLAVTWQGYRGSPWAWAAAWVLVLTIGATGLSFLVVSATAYQGFIYLVLAIVVGVALIVARRGLAEPTNG